MCPQPLTGASAGDVVGLVGKGQGVEVYAPVGHRGAILGDHALTPASDGLIRIRWVPDELWPLHRDRDRRVPRAAVLLDLLESDDPRARREAARALAS